MLTEQRAWSPETLQNFIASDAALHSLWAHARAVLDEDPGHDIEHCQRVALSALSLVPALDPRDVIAAALLHDIVNVPKNSPERARASELSAARAVELLEPLGFTAASIAEISAAIRDHSFSAGRTPATLLGCALQDADRLESLGALGLLRTISTGARMGARYFHAADPWGRARAFEDRLYSVDHFFTKLFQLPARMLTPQGRREAERRTEFLRVFLEQLASELGIAAPRFDRE